MVFQFIVNLVIACIFANYVSDVKKESGGAAAVVFFVSMLMPLLVVIYVHRMAKKDQDSAKHPLRTPALVCCYLIEASVVFAFALIILSVLKVF